MTNLPPFLENSPADAPDILSPRGVTPFYLPNQPVRGRLVRLGPLAHTLLTRHAHPTPVRALLGQALALTAGLATALKYEGSFSVQTRGDGPVSMLVADCTDTGALRGYARVDKDATLEPDATADALLGAGYIAFTVDHGIDRDPSQGIVALEGESLSAMAETYFVNSEQFPARIFLAAAETAQGWRASALILERIAGAGGIDPSVSDAEQEEAWNTACILADTITAAELLDDSLAPERLLYRLFHADDVAQAPSRPLSYGCRCSRPRLAGILEGFTQDDLDHMVVDGEIVMTCEFCNYDFRFGRDTVTGRPDSPLEE